MANTNLPMVDLPEWTTINQVPVASSALSAMTTKEEGNDRFLYYVASGLFYRLDTWADTYQQLATPPLAPTIGADMVYSKRRGYHQRVLAATSTTVTLPGLRNGLLNNESLLVLSGTGAGQERVLTFAYETTHDAGVVTTASTLLIADSLKKWAINQWVGYLVGITYGTNATQYKKVLYNDATQLFFSDANLQPHEPWNNQPFNAIAPYALPVAGSHYQIMSSTYNVPAWDVVPDSSSYTVAQTGGIYLFSSAAAAPFMSLQYYDVAHDVWQTKTVSQSLALAVLSTDFCIERTGKIGTALATKIGAVTGTVRTLADAGQALSPGAWDNHRLVITGGTGMGQTRRIVWNTATTFTVSKNWDVNPDSTSTYEVWPDYNRIYMLGNANSSLLAYDTENDIWSQGAYFDDGIVNAIAATQSGWASVGVTSGTRIALGIQSINAAPTAGGTLYSVGDTLTCAVGGAGAQVIVTSIGSGGVVTGLALVNAGTGTGYTVGTGKATTGGTGTGCTINVTAVGPTANIVCATAAWFKRGDTVRFSGCTDAAWNANYVITGVSQISAATITFSVNTTAAANMATALALSATVLTDSTKSWVVNEHVGRILHNMLPGTGPAAGIRWIVSNTANTITTASGTAPVAGTGKYVIYDSKAFGTDDQRKEDGMSGYGAATGGSTTTLVDSSKNWIPDQWAGYVFKIEAGTGYGSGRITIISNTATTLTYALQSFTPDTTVHYEIADCWGLPTAGALSTLTETGTKKFAVNQWAGKRMRITAGTLVGTETTITANTATAMTITGTPAADSVYAILAIQPRGAGTNLVWTWGASTAKGKRQMYSPRGGGSNIVDVFDLASQKWQFGLYTFPQSELFNIGSSYAYDGVDTIYMTRSLLNNPVRVLSYNTLTNKIAAMGTTIITQNAVHIGNLLEIVDSPDGTPFMYSLQNTGTLMSRAVIL
jgi:hypothetical protein